MKQKGFTLIELVVVILIVGILSVTASTKFLGVSSDARTATMEGVKGAIQSAADVTYGKLATLGYENNPALFAYGDNYPDLTEWCELCYFIYGYPGNMTSTFPKIMAGVAQDNSEEIQAGAGGEGMDAASIYFSFPDNFEGHRLKVDNCYVQYIPPIQNKTKEYSVRVVPCA